MSGRWFIAGLLLTTGSAACAGGGERGQLTATACPDSSTLSYEADIAPMMTRYCVTCHGATVPVASRHGAPTDHNFDTQLGLLEEAQHVDEAAGSNGTITNTSMPPRGYPAPTIEERKKLSEWLACNAPVNTEHQD